MKKQITILGLSFLLVTALALTAFQQEKGKGNKQEQKQDKGKGQSSNQGKGNSKNDNVIKDNKDKGNKGQGNDNQQDNQGRGNSDNKNNDKENRGNDNNKNDGGLLDSDNLGKGKVKMAKNRNGKDIFVFDPETFRERDRIFRKSDKVTICHKFDGDEPPVNINVSVNAQQAHLNHGDVLGECPAYTGGVFSDIFLDRRNDYYNVLQRNYEQQLYSRSLLDYAMERLGIYRTQLTTLQNNGAPASVIQSRQVAIVDLEQNVSTLERLLGVAATLAVNKLVD